MIKSIAPRSFRNIQFIEHFDHVEPFIMTTLILTEEFDTAELPLYTLNFTEGFDS